MTHQQMFMRCQQPSNSSLTLIRHLIAKTSIDYSSKQPLQPHLSYYWQATTARARAKFLMRKDYGEELVDLPTLTPRG
jgi:hypothetical protein